MNNLVIRSYLPKDTEDIKELYKLASVDSEIGYRDGPWFNDFDTIEDYYLTGGDFFFFLIDNEIVVMVGLQKISDDEGHIRRMRTHPEHRRKGYAQQILVELENRAKKKRFKELRLRTSTQQKMAQKLYEKSGYEIMKTEKSFYAEGGGNTFEVVWYRKHLA